MSNVVKDRLSLLRTEMTKTGADWYFCTSDDFHGSEYVADYFKVREYYTGFTGENAFLLLNNEVALMWTDGRFFLQAANELEGTGVTLMKMGEPDVPMYTEYLAKNLKAGQKLFFDGRMVSSGLGSRLERIANDNGAEVCYAQDIAGALWNNRPARPSNPITVYDETVTGESVAHKLGRIRDEFSKLGAEYNFIGSIDDIAWITNMRGSDIECNPVFLSYLLIRKEDAVIFMQDSELSERVCEYLNKNGFVIEDYDKVVDYISTHEFTGAVLVDEASVNYTCLKTLSDKASLVKAINPSKKMKAIKNETEINRLKEIYLEDSVCVTKFCYWLKQAVKTQKVTEMSAAAHIDNLRKQVPGFLDLSFPTISGYAANGAIVHYGVTEESNTEVKRENMLLVDSGGQYEKGTTDVTRTISVGIVNDKMKLYYSKVAAGMLSLAAAKFPYGCTGRNVDTFARAPLWEIGADYNHGTGHGVGYILNVHEGPQSIRWRFAEGVKEYPLEAGMITSDEPGIYITGEFGIRIENVILCVEDKKTDMGKFLGFEHLTYAPLDRALLDKNALTDKEISLVNAYQQEVYNRMKGHLSKEEDEWLFEETRPL